MRDIEDIIDSSCPQTNNNNNEFDVVIVGGGVIGCSIARELSRFKDIRVIVLEKEKDIAQGQSKSNSGIIHGGYDAKHGTLKGKLVRKGNKMFENLNKDLEFGYKRIGSLVLAFNEKEEQKLVQLFKNGTKNGVDDLQLLSGEEARKMEPFLSLGVRKALFCPSAGVVSPYEYTFSLAENAIQNGVEVLVGEEVIAVHQIPPPSLSPSVSPSFRFDVETKTNKKFRAKFVINCAGIYSDRVANFVRGEGEKGKREGEKGEGFTITPRKGDYLLLSKSQGNKVKRVIFQTPTDRWGKGILVSPTVAGNLLLGPSAIPMDAKEKENRDTDTEELAYVVWSARRSVPHLDTEQALTSFAGVRARPSRGDFIIEESEIKGFINVAGIESPGLTSSPAIAEMVVGEVLRNCSPPLPLSLKPLLPKEKEIELSLSCSSSSSSSCSASCLKTYFYPKRHHPVDYLKNEKGFDGRYGIINDPERNIICRCEGITEAEINQAIEGAGFPLRCTDSIKWRTRAGMGFCQGRRCRPLVAARLAKNLEKKYGEKVSPEMIPKRVPGMTVPERESRDILAKL